MTEKMRTELNEAASYKRFWMGLVFIMVIAITIGAINLTFILSPPKQSLGFALVAVALATLTAIGFLALIVAALMVAAIFSYGGIMADENYDNPSPFPKKPMGDP